MLAKSEEKQIMNAEEWKRGERERWMREDKKTPLFRAEASPVPSSPVDSVDR